MKLRSALLLSVVTSLLASSVAFAEAEKHYTFPTDTLPQFKTGITAGYQYSFTESDGQVTTTAKTYQDTRKINKSKLVFEANEGLGYGFQLGVKANYATYNRNTITSPKGTSLTEATGWSNPDFAIRFNPMKALGKTHDPFQAILEYSVAPKGITSEQLAKSPSDSDTNTNTARAVVSYRAFGLNTYAGYVGEFRGHQNNLKIEDSQHVIFGTAYPVDPKLIISLGCDFASTVNGAKYTSSFMQYSTTLTAKYRAMDNLWLIPAVGYTAVDAKPMVAKPAYTVPDGDGVSASLLARFVF